MKKTALFILLALTVYSCNKEKSFSRKLMKGEIWEVEAITIDGTALETTGNWNVTQDVDIYDSVPQVSWSSSTMVSVFEWQFQEKGKKFLLSYVQQCIECDGSDLSTLDYLTYNLTGKYDVEQHRRNKMKFTSEETLGYLGQTVEISIQRLK